MILVTVDNDYNIMGSRELEMEFKRVSGYPTLTALPIVYDFKAEL